ncbi:MAG TPA: L-arabinose isomerase [Cyclobacteriaceae bacterium]|nr:L-arabinose isomerase [Cyclobacteriaceae bacterium]
MENLKRREAWLITGSQHLYGRETLERVDEDSKKIAQALDRSPIIQVKIVFKTVLTTADDITRMCRDANASENCIGIIAWMHTFSPAKMWITGLLSLRKPMLHLHTQFNRDIPWGKIDMDFMNLNQSAHGDREFGFISSRLRINRKVVVGHWQDKEVLGKISTWASAACAWNDWQVLKVARFGDNMRDVAVTEGDKVAAQSRFGFSVQGFGVGDLARYVNDVSGKEVLRLLDVYKSQYRFRPGILKDQAVTKSLKEAAKIEIGMRRFLEEGGFKAFTTTFEDLHGLHQLPGLAIQRLMADGFGYGAEGDWKTAALVRAVKVMGSGLKGGTSFMEDYTYHLDPKNMTVLGAHMLEVCPSIATSKPSLEVHPLSIGGKGDPARLVFKTAPGPGLNASLIDLGNRFRLIVNMIKAVTVPEMPKLPVARVLWKPLPDLKTAASAWILAGGAHHTVFTKAVSPEYLEDFTEMAGIEYLLIDQNTDVNEFKKEMKLNEVYYLLAGSLKL